MSTVLTAEGREIMNRLMDVFLDLAEDAKSRAVIFTSTNHRDAWNTERDPDIVTDEQLPRIPAPNPSGAYLTTTRVLIQYVSKTAAKQENYFPFRVEGFAFEGEEVAHFVFTAVDDDKLVNLRTRYLKNAPPERKSRRTATEPASTNPTPSTSAAEDVVDSVQKVSAEKSHSKRYVVEVPPTDEREPSDDDMRAIVSRLGAELEENLKNKMKIFRGRSVTEEHDTVIFSSDRSLWREAEYLVMHDTEPTPPIPSSYDHEKFDIARDIRDYLHNLAREQDCAPFYASALRVGKTDSATVHLLFSRYEERTTKYVKSIGVRRAATKTTAPDVVLELYKRRRETVAKIEHCDAADESVAKHCLTELQSRLGLNVTRDLDQKIQFYLERAGEEANASMIFTNRDDIWWYDEGETVITVEGPLPPFPSNYASPYIFDMVQDMVDYVARKISEKRLEPGTVSSLQFGDKDYEQVHLVVSPFDKPALNYLNCALPDYERLPSPTITPSTVMVSGVYSYNPIGDVTLGIKENLIVKQRVRSFPVVGHYQREPSVGVVASTREALTTGAEPAKDEPPPYEAPTHEKMDTS